MLTILIPRDKLSKHILLLWFILSVVALAFSGIYSFLPIVHRAPFLAEFFQRSWLSMCTRWMPVVVYWTFLFSKDPLLTPKPTNELCTVIGSDTAWVWDISISHVLKFYANIRLKLILGFVLFLPLDLNSKIDTGN